MIARTRWDADTDIKLRLLFVEQKQDARQVAACLGRTVAAVRNRISVLRNDSRVPRGQRGGWTAEADAALIALRREGLTAKQIAARMNRTKPAIDGRVSVLGLAKSVPLPNKRQTTRVTLRASTRPCLCCTREFASSGAGNRMICGRKHAEWGFYDEAGNYRKASGTYKPVWTRMIGWTNAR